MTLKKLSELFNRAAVRSFEISSILLLFCTLFVCGTIFLFFRGIAFHLEAWWRPAVFSIPLFIVLGFLLATEILVFRRYFDVAKPLRKTLFSSWELMVKTSYLAFPFFLAFLLLWVLSGLFLLLQSIPYLGTFLGIIFAFTPFLFNLAAILLFFAAIFLLFFVVPGIARSGEITRSNLFMRLQGDIFTNLLLFATAFFPLWIVYKILILTWNTTLGFFPINEGTFEQLLRAFFMMIPFVAILSPAVNFFFNLAIEADIFFRANQSEK